MSLVVCLSHCVDFIFMINSHCASRLALYGESIPNCPDNLWSIFSIITAYTQCIYVATMNFPLCHMMTALLLVLKINLSYMSLHLFTN